MIMNKMLFLLFFGILLTACDHCCHKETFLYDNKSIEEIYAYANELNLNYCIVLLDSTQELSRQYKKRLESVLTSENAIYNLVDVNKPENEWYLKWLCPISLPLSCVFSYSGTLIDIIPGAAKESFLYTKDALSKGESTKFHFINHFNKDKVHIIPLYDQILKCSMFLRQGMFVNFNDSVLGTLNYPYPYYLRILGNIIENDTIGACVAAKEMIKLESPYYLSAYRNEFIIAKKTITPDFDISSDPNIRVSENVITLSDSKVGETVPFDVMIYNDGKQSLKVSEIYKSCTCLELKDSDNFSIPPQDSVMVHFTFKAEEKGEILRDIFITSNAMNTPILYVKVLANVL